MTKGFVDIKVVYFLAGVILPMLCSVFSKENFTQETSDPVIMEKSLRMFKNMMLVTFPVYNPEIPKIAWYRQLKQPFGELLKILKNCKDNEWCSGYHYIARRITEEPKIEKINEVYNQLIREFTENKNGIWNKSNEETENKDIMTPLTFLTRFKIKHHAILEDDA